jgi:hypothetical protein
MSTELRAISGMCAGRKEKEKGVIFGGRVRLRCGAMRQRD